MAKYRVTFNISHVFEFDAQGFRDLYPGEAEEYEDEREWIGELLAEIGTDIAYEDFVTHKEAWDDFTTDLEEIE